MNMHSENVRGWMRAKEVAAYLGISVATLWRWVEAGRIPSGTKLGLRTTAWPAEVIYGLGEVLAQKTAQEVTKKEEAENKIANMQRSTPRTATKAA